MAGVLEAEPLRLGEQFLVWHGLSLLKYSLNGPVVCHSKLSFFGALIRTVHEGFNWDTLPRCIAGFRPPTKPAHARKETYASSPRRRAIESPGSGRKPRQAIKNDRDERMKVLALAQARDVDVILVTELTRWGRSMLDLFHTLQDLQAWGVSLIAQTGLQFDLRSAQGKLIASLMAALAEFRAGFTA